MELAAHLAALVAVLSTGIIYGTERVLRPRRTTGPDHEWMTCRSPR